MVQIQGGTFTMGSPTTESGRNSNETQHEVTLTGFSMGKYPVTEALYETVMGYSPSSKAPNTPVGEVSWYDTIVFCNTLSMLVGLSPAYEMRTEADTNVWSTDPATWGTVPGDTDTRWNEVRTKTGSTGYRLPTEAQWEYACRAGTTTAYNTGDALEDHTGWHSNNSNWRIHAVGEKPANAWGLYDMHGNTWDWCWDWLGAYTEVAQTDPTGVVSGNDRVLRGGSWSNTVNCRSAARFGISPNRGWNADISFRLVRP
jgi:formylglycine-generating enzyme required for sulfatase activity